MVIYRLAPGETAPWAGTYRLVEHYGERKGRTVSVKRGEQLPLVEVDGDFEMWFVFEGDPEEAINAA
jgi:hypothetical protein